jgi:predicted Fe-Mo cluster-binding NifX family protein
MSTKIIVKVENGKITQIHATGKKDEATSAVSAVKSACDAFLATPNQDGVLVSDIATLDPGVLVSD